MAMFVLSKLYLFLADPGFWVLALLLAATALLWTRWRRGGRLLLTGTVAFITLVSVFPVGGAMIALLEQRFPPVRNLEAAPDGIIVLGGSVNQFITAARGQPALTGGAERLTEAVALAHRFPKARIVFTGGSGSVRRQDLKEAMVARMFFDQMGIDPDRLELEDASRNTLENAILTRLMVDPKPGERWLLITSASHMPRAMGCFRKAGWEPIPYPVDFHTAGLRALQIGFNMSSGLGILGEALYEYMALAAYRLLGRTDALFPAPQPEKAD